MAQGFLALILHAHLPFVRHPDRSETLQEHWLFEAITESYVPLLLMLEGLLADGLDFRLTLTISPTLAAMLADPLLQGRYLRRLGLLLELGEKECLRTRSQPDVQALARGYTGHLRQVHRAFVERFDRDLVAAFGRLQKLGRLEIMATAATHAYLPLLAVHPAAVRAQVRIGVAEHRRLFGRAPTGFWLPECGFYPGVDQLLADEGIGYTINETHGVSRAAPRPRHGVYAPVACPSGVAVFGRDPESSRQVWSAAEGYPGDGEYREFYRDIGQELDRGYLAPYILPDSARLDTGFKYWRITGGESPKELYDPERARMKARSHAADFLSKRQEQVTRLAPAMDRPPIVVAPYDAELFGHWWFEGPLWLDSLIRLISTGPGIIQLVTLSEYLAVHPASHIANPCSSSWGRGGFHEPWLNPKNDWIYPHLHQGAARLAPLAASQAGAEGLRGRALRQAARELLLAQASDWAFMMDSGTMTEYATLRTKTHLTRLRHLARQIEDRGIDEAWLAGLEKEDNIFPDLDPMLFTSTL